MTKRLDGLDRHFRTPIRLAVTLWASVALQAQAPTNLGTLGGLNSDAVAMNDGGQVVGYSELASSGAIHAFSWTRAGGMIDLGTLGGVASIAFGVNNSGQVVGESDKSDGRVHGFLWTQAGGMIDLGTDTGRPTQQKKAQPGCDPEISDLRQAQCGTPGHARY